MVVRTKQIQMEGKWYFQRAEHTFKVQPHSFLSKLGMGVVAHLVIEKLKYDMAYQPKSFMMSTVQLLNNQHFQLRYYTFLLIKWASKLQAIKV